MAERDRFELDLADALRAYAQDAPTQVRPTELARHFASVYPHRRTVLDPGRLLPVLRVAWLLLLAAIVLAAMVGGMLVGGSQLQWKSPAVIAPVASPTANPDSASPSPTALSPTANPDEALVADLSALMSDPYDAARVAALYAPNAVIHETTANLTQTGLEQIGARIREFNDGGFKTVVASAPIRQGNFVAVFAKYGTGGDLSNGALVVLELEGGKVLNHWVYPAP
jgi:hypothetical protein